MRRAVQHSAVASVLHGGKDAGKEVRESVRERQSAQRRRPSRSFSNVPPTANFSSGTTNDAVDDPASYEERRG